jgi:hypothetical protein
MGHMKDLDRRIRQGGDDAIAAVSELLPRWISVEERLPEDGEWVLWFNKSWDCPIVVARRDGKSLDWGGDLYWTLHGFTHWMTLPEPPRLA